MPYVKQERRPALDKVVDAMLESDIKADGDLNYVLFKYFLVNVPERYNSIKNYCAELIECTEEIRRTVLSKYEDKKRLENGEII